QRIRAEAEVEGERDLRNEAVAVLGRPGMDLPESVIQPELHRSGDVRVYRLEHASADQVFVEALIDVVPNVDAGLGRSIQDRGRDPSAGGERISYAGVVLLPVSQERGEVALRRVSQPHDAGVLGDVVELVDHPGLKAARDAEVVAVG